MVSKLLRFLLIVATIGAVVYLFIYDRPMQSLLPESLNPFAAVAQEEPQPQEEPIEPAIKADTLLDEVEITPAVDSLHVEQCDTLTQE